MLKPIQLLAGCLATMAGFSQEPNYAADRIPDSLTKNAVAVVRYEKETFEVSETDRATYRSHNVTTVLNSAGDSYLQFVFEGNKFIKLGDVDIKVYDANGKQIQRYKKKDLQSFNIGEGLIDDLVRNYIFFPHASYPITVETQFEILFKGLLSYPAYRIASPHVSVMNSSFTAIIPKQIGVRFKAKNTNIVPVSTDDGKTETHQWKVSNAPAIFYEDGTVTRGKSYPHILLAPNKFKLDNYEGDMSSWKNFGNWYYQVCAGTDKLSEPRIAFYKDMVKSATTDLEKTKIIYDYLQKNFRYVSIQLGIGGQKPLPASFTDEKKYGDCKGLSNYVLAVLKGLGIKSHLVIINRAANDEPLDTDFPIDQFNHVVLLVPNGRDSIWLECTSKIAKFGQLDISTENRNAVLVTENGGFLINTPVSNAANNLFAVSSKIELQENGGGSCKSSILGTGEYNDELLYNLSERKSDDQKAYLVRRIGYKQPDEFVIARIADIKGYNTDITLAIEKVSEFMAGSKMFLAPHIYKFWTATMPANEKRQRDYFFDKPFLKSDTTVYKLPAGFTLDLLPTGKSFACATASYQSSFSYNEKEGAVYSISNLELKKHKIAPGEYQATKEFFDKVLKEESQRIVIKKGEAEKLKAF